MRTNSAPRSRFGLLAALTLLGALAAIAAPPPAGSLIGNQATATYTDAGGTTRTVTSNVVYVQVQQVGAFTLTADATKYAAPGSQVALPHTLQNTGNGNDTYALSLTQLATDNFNLTGAAIYRDADSNGVPDNLTPITSTGVLAAGDSFRFVVVGTVPASAVNTNRAITTVTGLSALDAATQTNTDTVIVTNGAVITATKAVNVLQGPAPSGPYTFTISYNNNGLAAATNVKFTDLLPSQMTYVPGSGRWSGSGATALTDATGGDPAGIAYDYNITTPGVVTATLASVASGQSGTLTMQVTVDAGLQSGPVPNTCAVQYNDGLGNTITTSTNTTVFTVTETAAVGFTGQTVVTANQGSTVTFHNTLTNNGNAVDTFDIVVNNAGSSFPAGTNSVLYKSDGVTLLLDTNNNGTVDTGPVAPAGTYDVVLKAILPPGASGTGPFTVQKTATSANDPTKTQTATDTLNTIVGNRVDLTNNKTVAGGAGAADGLGSGPEPGAVVALATNPGTTVQIPLYVNNTSGVSDTFNLAASMDPMFGALTLPPGAVLVFKTIGGTVITNTGSIPAGGSLEVIAEITFPAGAAAATYPLYFQVQSPTSGAADVIHDQVSVNPVRNIALLIDNIGQVSAGGSVTYTHTIRNLGNVKEGDGVVSTVGLGTTDSGAGFSSAIYWDKNNNGILDPTDAVVADLSALSGGSNGASTGAGLDVGESATLFVVVYAGPGVAVGSADRTVLTATTNQGTYPVAAPAAVIATDNTTVIAGDVVLSKAQALDADKNGTPDTAYTQARINADPGQCIRYELTITNQGKEDATNVIVSDALPTWTTYHTGNGTLTATGKACWTVVGSGVFTACTAPASGATGTIRATIPTLAAGQTVKVTFGALIQQ